MALVKCPECGNQVSDRASACPKCGYPFRQQEPAQERKKKTPTPPTGLEDSTHMHEVDAKLQAIPETGRWTSSTGYLDREVPMAFASYRVTKKGV